MSDTYFVVAHFHYTVFGTVVFLMFAGLLLLVAEDDRQDARRAARQEPLLAAVHRLPGDLPDPALARRQGMPRRYGDYLPADDFELLNQISTVGSAILGVSTLFFLYNVFKTWRTRADGRRRRPVGLGRLAGVGDVLPAAAAQLHLAAADPLRAAGLRPAPSRARGRRGPSRRRPPPPLPAREARQ